MAFGKYSRVDGRKQSNYCSTFTIVLFVGLCLVAAWMLMSSSVVPVPSSELSSQQARTEQKSEVSNTDSRQFEDGSGDLPIDATTNDDSTNSPDDSNSDGSDTRKYSDKVTQENTNEKTETEEETPRESENDGGESNSGGESSSGDDESDQGGRKVDLEDNESKSDGGESSSGDDLNSKGYRREVSDESNGMEQPEQEEVQRDNKPNSEEGEKQPDKEKTEETDELSKENIDENQEKNSQQSSGGNKMDDKSVDPATNEVNPAGEQAEILNEATTQNGAWSTQAAESENEKKSQKSALSNNQNDSYKWKTCNVTAGPDYIPCLDNVQAIRKLTSTTHYEHRERHCPEEAPTCLVRLPEGYKTSIRWPKSREQIWYKNVPHAKLAEVKGHQNWVKVAGDYLTFPGGGTQFKNGALHYIDFIQKSLPKIAWGKHSRVILDVGCGVASFGGYLFERDVLAMSFAPKDEHEAQIQFALERGIPGISAVMGTKRLHFPSKVFDIVHCARCRVPWHIEGGKLLLELNRVLRPGGYFVWSATPVYRNREEDVGIWQAMSKLTKAMCWDLVTIKKDKLNEVGAAIYRKPTSNSCYEQRTESVPPLCKQNDDPDAAWNVPLEACIHKAPVDASERGSLWPEQWPLRLENPPYWLNKTQLGVYGKAAPEDFTADYEHWKHVVSMSYLNGLGINWSSVRNVMDMRAVYGGFAAALKDLKVWVMNVVPIDSPDTLPIIYERGLFGIYHDWCESFNTYPRSYDLLHADHLFSGIKKRCKLSSVIAEVDRVLRPEGKLIVRDNVETIAEVENMARSLHWKIRLTYSKENEGLLCVEKTFWRPQETETIMSAIA